MVNVTHVGRVGALAVALGVGLAVANTPAVGYAQPTDSEPSQASDTAADVESPNSTEAPDPSEPDAQPQSVAAIAPADGGDVPDELEDAVEAGEGKPKPVEADDDGGSLDLAGQTDDVDADARGVDWQLLAADTLVDAATDVAPTDVAPESGELLAAAVSQRQQPVAEPPAVSATEPMNLADGPGYPTGGPLLVQVLSLVRDEFEKVLNSTPDAAVQPFTVPPPADGHLVPPEFTDPSTWQPFVNDAVAEAGLLTERMINVYDFGSPEGWAAFVLDYTWGLPWTMAGNGVHIINLFWDDSNYNDGLSYHQNHHVYDGGFRWWGDAAHTVGNVITDAGHGGPSANLHTVEHEKIHVMENRVFGPFYMGGYVAWFAVGAVAGAAVWVADPSRDLTDVVTTLAYYNNPWEYWAYKATDNWPASGANPDLILWP